MKNEATDIYEIVKWFLHVQPMTHKKLQKLLYFSYGIYLAQNNNIPTELSNRLFKNNFEAWAHGPVDPNVYFLYKNTGINLLYIENIENIYFDKNIMLALNKTMDIYGEYSADELEIISHNQSTWKNARQNLLPMEPSNNLLSDIDIFSTFKELLNNETV